MANLINHFPESMKWREENRSEKSKKNLWIYWHTIKTLNPNLNFVLIVLTTIVSMASVWISVLLSANQTFKINCDLDYTDDGCFKMVSNDTYVGQMWQSNKVGISVTFPVIALVFLWAMLLELASNCDWMIWANEMGYFVTNCSTKFKDIWLIFVTTLLASVYAPILIVGLNVLESTSCGGISVDVESLSVDKSRQFISVSICAMITMGLALKVVLIDTQYFWFSSNLKLENSDKRIRSEDFERVNKIKDELVLLNEIPVNFDNFEKWTQYRRIYILECFKLMFDKC